MVGIINYGLGNLGSIKNMLKAIGEKSVISSNPDVLDTCDRYILPGVGAFDAGMSKLNELGLVDYIKKVAQVEKKPILGICLGMQLLGRKSEEGKLDGLGLIPFDNIKFRLDNTELRVPHMGWDIVELNQDNSLLKNLEGVQRYYFVHSFHAQCDFDGNVLMTCEYGYKFAASVIKENIMGVQFHPEKSHDFGMALLRNFVKEC